MKRKNVNTETLLESFSEKLPGEDRHFGGDDFSIEMIPVTSHQFNARLMMPVSQWKHLRLYVIERSDGRCEFCEERRNLEVHERWDFDARTQTQILKRLMCLCKSCHLGVHIGLAGQIGYFDVIKQHVLAITGWPEREFSQHVSTAREKYERLSQLSWVIDASMLENAGIVLFSSEDVFNKVERRREQIRRQDYKFIAGSMDFSREVRAGHKAFCTSLLTESCRGWSPIDEDGFYAAGDEELTKILSESMDLKIFIEAFNNPVMVVNEEQLRSEMQSAGPKRIVLGKALPPELFTFEMIDDAFRRQVLFSHED